MKGSRAMAKPDKSAPTHSVALLPCPICGGDAGVVEYRDIRHGNKVPCFFVRCVSKKPPCCSNYMGFSDTSVSEYWNGGKVLPSAR